MYDSKETLFYIDPPYMWGTRVMGSNKKYYQHEMSDEDHENLLKALLGVKGIVVLSGYDNALYNDMLSEWEKFSTTTVANANRGSVIRTECVWLNPACLKRQKQLRLPFI